MIRVRLNALARHLNTWKSNRNLSHQEVNIVNITNLLTFNHLDQLNISLFSAENTIAIIIVVQVGLNCTTQDHASQRESNI